MSHALTAQDLFVEMKRMPSTERIKFFSLLTNQAFRDDDFTREQVFGHLQHEPLSAGRQRSTLRYLYRRCGAMFKRISCGHAIR